MNSFPNLSEREQRRSRFIGRVRRELKQALSRAQKGGLTQRELAKRLGCQPSVISRQLNGSANLTLKSIGDLAWALGLYPRFRLFTAEELSAPSSNSAIMYSTHWHNMQPQAVTTISQGGTAKIEYCRD